MAKRELTLDTITCPSCGEAIPVSETLSHQIAEKANAELKAEAARQRKAFEEKARELATREAGLNAAVEERVRAAKDVLARQAEQKVREAFALELEDLKKQAAERDNQLKAARAAELQLRQQKRELEDREKALDLELARKLDEERRRIEEATAKRIDDEHRLRDAEKDKRLHEALKANEELRRKLQQGSQQTQGEVLELHLEASLRQAFPTDHLAPVTKGVNGADLIQRVLARSGHHCGTIVWEAKRTKAWSDGWLQKLKDDQRLLKAELAVLVTEALPRDCHNFTQRDGVWITNPECALNLGAALRMQLTEVAMTKLAAVGKNEKMEVLFSYLSGAEFRQRVEAIVEAFIGMQQDLQEERRTAERRWAKREKQINRVILSTSGMYGDLQGLIGSSMQAIPALTASEDCAA